MRAQATESLPQLFQPLWQLTPSKPCLDTLWLMPNQSAAAHHLATPFPGPQPWEAPDPLPVRRRELKLLLRHGEFRVAGSVFKESRARTRQQWENALVLAERRAALGTR